jgi:trimeric autotransporter adhesin
MSSASGSRSLSGAVPMFHLFGLENDPPADLSSSKGKQASASASYPTTAAASSVPTQALGLHQQPASSTFNAPYSTSSAATSSRFATSANNSAMAALAMGRKRKRQPAASTYGEWDETLALLATDRRDVRPISLDSEKDRELETTSRTETQRIASGRASRRTTDDAVPVLPATSAVRDSPFIVDLTNESQSASSSVVAVTARNPPFIVDLTNESQDSSSSVEAVAPPAGTSTLVARSPGVINKGKGKARASTGSMPIDLTGNTMAGTSLKGKARASTGVTFVKASPSKASPSKASPSKASPSKASPSKASSSKASPIKTVPEERKAPYRGTRAGKSWKGSREFLHSECFASVGKRCMSSKSHFLSPVAPVM